MTKKILVEASTVAKKTDFWIDGTTSRVFLVDNPEEAFEKIIEVMEDVYCIEFSKNARKNKSKMYIDSDGEVPRQIGWTITGSVYIDFDGDYKKRYVECWVEMHELKDLEF